MKTIIVSRHPATVDLLTKKLTHIDRIEKTLPLNDLKKGDCIYGNLTAHLIAQVNQKGARYFHVLLNLPLELRGKELNAEDLEKLTPQIAEISAHIISQQTL